MENLNKDQLFLLAIELDLPNLLSFCGSSKRINELLCNRNEIWLHKLINEYPNYKDFNFDKNLKEIYTTLYQLQKLKEKLNLDLNYSLLDLYNLQEFNLYSNEIEEIPKEIGQLHNLQILDLSYNDIKQIPKEIGLLHNLQTLDLSGNRIKQIPKEIGLLHKLETLNLYDNYIKEIPKEIERLKNLQYFNLSDNHIKQIPKEIGQLHKLETLVLYSNEIEEIPKEIGQHIKIYI